jgi:hypothetical protein
MLKRALLIMSVVGLIALGVKTIGPDVRRYVRISRM